MIDRAGVDAARAFGTGCFKDHRTHDLRGLSESEIKVKTRSSDKKKHWGLFFYFVFFLNGVFFLHDRAWNTGSGSLATTSRTSGSAA